MAKEKTGIAGDFAEGMAIVRELIDLPLGEGTKTLFVRELGYLEIQEVYATARTKSLSALGLLVAAAVEDVDGNRFTYEEAMRLKREVAQPLFAKVASVQRIGEDSEKN